MKDLLFICMIGLLNVFGICAQTPVLYPPCSKAGWENALRSGEGETQSEAGWAAWEFGVPMVKKSVSYPAEERPAFLVQDRLSLEGSISEERTAESAVDLPSLEGSSIYRKWLMSGGRAFMATNHLEGEWEKLPAADRRPGWPAKGEECQALALSVQNRIKRDERMLLQVVEEEITFSPGCACEIVKAAILAINADAKKVATIVETAIFASPDEIRIISQCAIAAAPESLFEIQGTLAKFEPNAGERVASAKSAKGEKAAVTSETAPAEVPAKTDVLDLPLVHPWLVPPVIHVPVVTDG